MALDHCLSKYNLRCFSGCHSLECLASELVRIGVLLTVTLVVCFGSLIHAQADESVKGVLDGSISNNIVIVEITEKQAEVLKEAKEQDTLRILAEATGGQTRTPTTAPIRFDRCSNPFNAKATCRFVGTFLLPAVYRITVAKSNGTVDTLFTLKVLCRDAARVVASVDQAACVPDVSYFGRTDPRNDPSNIKLETVGTSGQFRMFLNPQSGLNAEAVFRPITGGFVLDSSSLSLRFQSFGLLPPVPECSGIYPLWNDLRAGIFTRSGFDVVRFDLEYKLKLAIPCTDGIIFKLHELIQVDRDRYPLIMSFALRYAPTLIVSDPFIPVENAYSVQFEGSYNIPLLSNFDLGLSALVDFDFLRASQPDSLQKSVFGVRARVYFLEGFGNYFQFELRFKPWVAPLDPKLELSFTLTATLESALRLLQTRSP